MHPRIVGRLCQTPLDSRLAFRRMELRGRERHGRAAHLGERAGANESNALKERRSRRAFTLIELLVVIAIIAILVGLLFPAFKAVQKQAKQTQAKNDLTQIVNAVNAYYTEYGKYPISTSGADVTFGPAGTTHNNVVFNELQGCPTTGTPPPTCSANSTLNTRQIAFISPPAVKNPTNPRSGIATQTSGIVNHGDYVDPWGTPYDVAIDGNYDNQLTNPYTADTGAGPATLSQGAIAWSWGQDQVQGTTNFSASDDVISWQ